MPNITSTTMRILIADDHRFVAEAVKLKLSEIEQNVEFVFATSIDELRALADGTLNLAIVELNMFGAQGCSHVDELRRRYPALPVVVLSGCRDPGLIHSLFEHGVLGFIPKASSGEVMLLAVRLVLAGGVYVPPLMLSASPFAGANSHAQEPVASPKQTESLRTMLTERQMEVLELLSQGKPNKLIARMLGISEGTVKIHLAAIFRSLNVRNRTEAVVAAQSLIGKPHASSAPAPFSQAA